MTILSARDLGFAREGRDALADVSFDIAPGSFTGLLGANGSGKTTLLRLLLGLIDPARGEVTLGAKPLKALTRRAIAASIAYVPQAHVAAFPFTVAEVVMMGRTAANGWGAGPAAGDRQAVAEVLNRIGMSAFADRSYAALSGGERQSVLIARALVQGARILLLDEPTASLDLGQRTRVMRMLAQLAAEGYAIVMSVHQPELVLRWCDRAILLKAGRVTAQGETAGVVTAPRLSDLYGVDLRIGQVEGRSFILT